MIYRLYEHLLQARIAKNNLPGCVAIVLSSGDLFEDGLVRLSQLLEWSRSIGLTSLVLYVNDDEPVLCRKIASFLAEVPAQISLHTAESVEQTGTGGPLKVVISLGYGGKREVAEAFRDLLREVETGHLDPEQINEKTIESHLRFAEKPDLVIRAGGKRLSDFMIWQAAYSELYFTDVNWQELRKIDFLRAIRDCQRRDRRFGR
jgi:undecaprenyl diphosphate synthase